MKRSSSSVYFVILMMWTNIVIGNKIQNNTTPTAATFQNGTPGNVDTDEEFDRTRKQQEENSSTTDMFSHGPVTEGVSPLTDMSDNETCAALQPEHSVVDDVVNSGKPVVLNVKWVGYVTVPLLFSTGIVGNVLVICVMCRPAFKNRSYSILTITLAITDLIMSAMFPFNKQFVIEMLQWDIRSQGWVGCRIFFWIWRTSKMSASWLVVLLSVERFVAVWLPLHVKQICTAKNGYFGSLLVLLVIGTFNGIWGSISDHLHNGTCLPNFPITKDLINTVKYLVITGSSVYCFVPGILIFIFNFLLVGKLYGCQTSEMPLGSTRTSKVGNKAWTMLVAISVAFVILVIPTGFLHCYSVFTGKKIYENNGVAFVIGREIIQVCEQLNHAVNFFLYFLCNKRFQLELKSLFWSEPPKNQMSMKSTSLCSYSL